LKTRNWDTAQKKILKFEAEGKDEDRKTILESTEAFIRDAEARGLRTTSVYKYRLLFKQLNAFAESKGLTLLDELDVDTLRQFRESWVNKNYSARKKLEALRTFFRFVHEAGWVQKNCALAIKPGKIEQPQVLPYSRDEFKRVIAACDVYPRAEHPNKYWSKRLKALVLLLRHSGLRIADVVTLSKQSIKNKVLILRTAKTGTDVRVPLPDGVIAALEEVEQPNGYYFWSGQSTKKSCVGDYQRAFKQLYKLAEVKNGHAHRWRHTFAVELLLARVPTEDVAALLGHQSIRVTEQHYSKWIIERQERLEATVRNAWERYNSDTVTV
jgi:integrase